MKEKLASYPVLAFPDSGEQFVVKVDACDYATGGVLSQIGDDGQLHPVAYYSTALQKSQQNWSPTTKEAFAMILAVRHWHVYLAGVQFVLKSDHNPLVYLRSQKDPRGKFARWISELEEYDYVVDYFPGPDNVVADPFSRNRNACPVQPESYFENNAYAVTDITNVNFAQQLRDEQNADDVISATKLYIENDELIPQGRFRRVQKQLRIENGILTKAGRPIIPPSMRKYVVEQFHSISHAGVDKMYALLQQKFYWPNLYSYIKTFVSYCKVCQQCKTETLPPKAPLMPMIVPEAPMQFILINIAHMPVDGDGYQYLLMMGDIFSKYIELAALRDQTAISVVQSFYDNWIMRHGSPLYLLSDQGSNVDGETMNELCSAFEIEKRRSSAYHSQGNGFAERNIRSVREIFRTVLLDRKLSQKHWRKSHLQHNLQ